MRKQNSVSTDALKKKSFRRTVLRHGNGKGQRVRLTLPFTEQGYSGCALDKMSLGSSGWFS